jgi:opacity protein-like surface antigen
MSEPKFKEQMKMKTVLFLIFFSFTSTFAQMGMGAIKIGHFSPSTTEGGFIIGFEGGRAIDRNLNIGVSLDWFHKDFIDKKLVQNLDNIYGIGGGSINELRAQTNLHDLPLMLNLTANFPVAPYINLFATGGVGAEVLLISYSNFQNPGQDEFKSAFDFNWSLGGGIAYMMGPRSDIFGELSYHYSQPGWQYEVYDPVINRNRTFERSFDMSGMMFRIGIRFYY